MEKMQAYASTNEVADKLREKIKSLPNNLMEELKTMQGGTKFEFYGSMRDGVELMGLGASTFGKV